MSSVLKKRKIADERRVFQEKWEHLYFFTAVSDRSHSLICQKKIAVIKEYNLRQHYEAMHQDKFFFFFLFSFIFTQNFFYQLEITQSACRNKDCE